MANQDARNLSIVFIIVKYNIICMFIKFLISQVVYPIFRINLKPTDFKDNQILSRPIDSYEKHRATFQLNKTGRISLFFRYQYYSPLY